MPVSWVRQDTPPAPKGFIVRGDRAPEVGQHLLSLPGPRRAGALGLAGSRTLVVLGDELPWHDAVTWIAPLHPSLWVPTTLRPELPASLLIAALDREQPGVAAPRLLLPDALLSLTGARPIDDAYLASWLASE